MKRNALEWVVLGVSVGAIVALLGFLVIDAVTSGDEPPSIGVELDLDGARQESAGWVIPATVRNEGGDGAESIVVEAEATVGGEPVVSQVSVDLLAAESEADVVFGFPGRPDGDVVVRLVGYGLP